ncbi:efflux RND transporter permease subunit [Cysteiniphilum sp. QT6929]|uniref:efflux RND transporter permease subunit n=1 Tax=Cysteiniphilum sp. QT6929 TaxID=2975055 RepID=UPI0024B33C10|nr:efflux RND transporter permease subunit [Cysteiniphilum sp. QT6929]WHN65512.1 efflux RND transporter permease subunit [Cysteiniphilum sp. QT6929]
MKLPEICIKRPVLSFVLNAILVLCGLLSFSYVKLQFEPTVFKPVLMIQTNYPGASADVVQKDVTQQLVAAISGTENLSYIEATSMQDQSQIKLNFGNIDQEKFITAQSEVMRDIAGVNLPQNAQTPQIKQRGDGSQVMLIGFQDSNRSTESLTSYINDTITKQLAQIPGVGDVQVYSEGSALRIELDPKAMAILKISAIDVVNKLEQLNRNVSAGQLITNNNTYTINVDSALDSISKFENLIIAKHNGKLIYLKQIAKIYLGNLSLANGSISIIDGKSGVVVNVSQTSDANPIDVANAVEKAVKQMQGSLPPGMKASVLFNVATSLKASLYEVIKTIIEAIILVSLISLLFLGRFRAALVPIVTLPVCLIGVFVIIWPLGFSINMMTLLAIVLAVGLVVDDAIVVLENCYRYMQKGYNAFDAAILGSKEIGFAIIGMTITLVAVYIPIAFMNDKSAVFFREFAFTLAASVLISGFVALTLSPTMCAHTLGKAKESRYEKFVTKLFANCEKAYKKSLYFVLQVRFWVIAIFVILIIAGIGLFRSMPTALQPNDTIGVVGVNIVGQSNASSDFIMQKLDEIQDKLPSKVFDHSFGFVDTQSGQTSGFSMNILREDQVTNAYKVARELNGIIKNTQGIQGSSWVFPLSGRNQSGDGDIQMYILSMDDYQTLYKKARSLVTMLEKLPTISHAGVGTAVNSGQFDMNINYTNAALLDVDPANIQTILNIMFGGWQLSRDYETGGESFPIYVQLPKKDLKSFNVLNRLYIKTDSGGWVQLGRLVSISPVVKIPYLTTYNQMHAMEMDINLQPNASMGQVVEQIKAITEQLLPGTSLAFKGDAKDMLEGNNSMIIIFIAGLLFIYLVLAALFESFIDPFIILLTVPLCVIGALLGLKLIGGTLNIYTDIGLITLIGLVSKHGVLIVQFSNELLAKGASLNEAVIKGAATRLRPILMTSATMILGAIPLLLSTGVGEHARQQIGMVIVAGLLLGSLFSLFIVPVAYQLLKSIRTNKPSKTSLTLNTAK